MKHALGKWSVALAGVAVATGLTEASFALGAELTFEWYVAAIAFIAWMGGRRPGIAAALVSCAVIDLVFLPYHHLTFGLEVVDAGRLVVFLGLAAFVAHLVAARAAAEDERRGRERLLASVAHELGNMLLALRAWTAAIHRGSARGERLDRVATSLECTADAIGQLVGDLLDWSRITLGKLDVQTEDVALDEVIRDAIEAMRSQAEKDGVAVSSSLAAIRVHADRRRLQQVALNLLTNALRASERGGEVSVSVRTVDHRAILAVRDTGRGIAPEALAHCFDFGVQASNGDRRGLGLGLAVSRDLVRAQGGDITVESAGIGTGATFFVDLPVALAARERRRGRTRESRWIGS